MITKQERYAQAVEWAHRYSVGMTEELGNWQTNEAGIVTAWKNMGPELRTRWLAEAIDGSAEEKLMWDCLKHLAAYLLRHDLELPEALSLWVADLLEGKRERQGYRPESTFCRDVFIALMVEWVVRDCDINATRNDGSEPLSSCDAMAEALNLSYKLIEKAWFEHRDTVS